MAEILLSTLNARWTHASLGLRWLLANMGPLAPRAALQEHTIADDPVDVAAAILSDRPRVVGLAVYIWNLRQTTEVARIIRRISPETRLVLGGPEVSHDPLPGHLTGLADAVIAGEAELAFPRVCDALLTGDPTPGFLAAASPDLAGLALPYNLYTDEDIAHRVLYVETVRGCPERCAFCLSALDPKVRRLPREPVIRAIEDLRRRGAARFKFVDRCLTLGHGPELLDAWAADPDPPSVHFELTPRALSSSLRSTIARYPPGRLQLEVGVQTFAPDVARRIGRRQDPDRVAELLSWLRAHTGVHVHADLVAGLPGETLTSFAEGFDRLVALGPQEIQVGLLKRLRGAPIASLTDPFEMIYRPDPPYEVLSTATLGFETLRRLHRLGQLWDRVVNRGHLPTAAPLLWRPPERAPMNRTTRDENPGAAGSSSPFHGFLAFTDWVHARTGRSHSLGLPLLVSLLLEYLTGERGLPPDQVGPALLADYRKGGRRDTPRCLRPWAREPPTEVSPPSDTTPADDVSPPDRTGPLPRQRRHLLHREDGPTEDGPTEDGPPEDIPPEDIPPEDGPTEDGPTEDGPTEDGSST